MSAGVDVRATVAEFFEARVDAEITPLHAGHINDSYFVAVAMPTGSSRYVLQRLNTRIFHAPAEVMENVDRITRHLRAKRAALPPEEQVRRAPVLRRTPAGVAFVRDDAGGWWRLLEFVDGGRTRLTVSSPAEARAAAAAFGEFQRLLEDLPAPRLHETLPRFHDTPARVAALRAAVAEDVVRRAASVAGEIRAALDGAAECGRLLSEAAAGRIPERVVHNDAKISNVRFDAAGGAPLCVIDYDTVMPGLSLHDFGDMVRSMACPAAEDEPDLSRVVVDPALFAALAEGYLGATGAMLNAVERALLVYSGWLMAYEQGVRFLTDYLRGDTYYKCARPGQNLDRARAQLHLAGRIHLERKTLEKLATRA